MKVATQSEIAANFAEYVKATKSGPVVVTSKGKPVAVLLRTEGEEDLERLLMGHSPKLQSILEAARKRLRAGHGIHHESFSKEVEADFLHDKYGEVLSDEEKRRFDALVARKVVVSAFFKEKAETLFRRPSTAPSPTSE